MKKFYAVVMVSLPVFLAKAQVSVNNELKSLITQSFTYFPKVREAENMVKTSEEKLALTKINKLPEVTGNASYAYIQPKITIPFPGGPGGSLVDFQFAPVHAMNAGVNASYTLFDFGRIEAAVQKSKDDIQFAKHNADNARVQLANQVTQIYYNIVYLKKAIDIQDSVILFLTDNLKLVAAKLKDGDALKIDVLNIQTQINEEQNRKVDLQNLLDRQKILLEYTTGIKQQKGLNFDFEVNLTDADAALATAKANNIEFQLIKDKIKQAESDVTIAKTADKPFVGLQANTGYKNGYVPDVTEMRFNYQAGIGLSIPIYNGGKAKQQTKLAETFVKQNQLAAETLNSNYKRDIEQTLTDIQSNMERIRYTQKQIDDAKYAQQLAATRFKNGVSTNLELTNAATTTQKIELMELKYQFQLCLSKVDLAKLMGYTYW